MAGVTEKYVNMDSKELLKEVFGGWSYGGFDFPKLGETTGCVGGTCISKPVRLYLRRRTDKGDWNVTPHDSRGLLSMHMNFKVNCEMLKQSSRLLRVELAELHLTVRRTRVQDRIDDAGSSILTASESIHINANTDWKREQNFEALIKALANEMPTGESFTVKELYDFLTGYRRITTAHVRTLAADFLVAVAAHLARETGVPAQLGMDATFTGR